MTTERAAESGAAFIDKESLFCTADIISLHLALGETTKGIVGAEDFGRMKSEALLINTSRGPLMDHDASIAALSSGQIGGGCIDVYDIKPLADDATLRTLPNAVLTPHL